MITPAFLRTPSAALSIRALAALAIALALAAGIHVGTAGAHEDDDPRADQAEYTREFVAQAVIRYEQNGLGETLAHYNNEASIDGQWYVFIFDTRDVLVAHAPNPDLVGLHSSNVLGPNDYPSGDSVVAVARANPEGAWLDYTYPNPATGDLETKHSYVMVHDGLVFGSGWYEPGPSRSQPAEYTQAVVAQAANLYDALGRDAAVSYYGSAGSVDGQWYVFIADEQDVLIANPARPRSVGLTPDRVIGANGYPAGEAVAAVARANPDGAWIEYVFPNPASGRYEVKNSWVIVHDGLVFGSGWYEPIVAQTNLSGFTKAFVGQAINLYDAVGLERTLEYYNSAESADGQWYVYITGEDGIIVAHPTVPENVGRHILGKVGVDAVTDHPYGLDILAANSSGSWVRYNFLNPVTGETERKNTWVVRHDGLLFASGWYGIAPDVIGLPATGDRTFPAGWLAAIGLGGFLAISAGAGTLALQRRRGRSGNR